MAASMSHPGEQLAQRLKDKTAKCAVIGLGYVGLPLCVELARAGYHVTGIDVDDRKITEINAGRSYIPDIKTEVLAPLVQKGLIRAARPGQALAEADTISICVPTPLGKSKDPDMSFIVAATRDVKAHVRAGQLIILESTTYPGTTQEVILPEIEAKGLKVGEHFFLAFSPERVDPGNPVYNTHNTPKVVGGVTKRCTELATMLYQAAVERVIPVSSPAAAELVKLLENTFRSVNIGLVNEVAIMCKKLGADVWEVISAAATKPFGFMPFYPGPGLGGHCIPIDPYYLSWKLKSLNYHARFIELAGEINSHMPEYVRDLCSEALNRHKKPVNGSKVLVLGVAYKRDIDDCRESPALDVMALLERSGAHVSYTDPYVPELDFEGKTWKSVPFDAATIAAQDLVVVTTDHRKFDAELVAKHAKLVVDARNFLAKFKDPERIIKL